MIALQTCSAPERKQDMAQAIAAPTVNTASRMESGGEPGRIQVTQAVKEKSWA